MWKRAIARTAEQLEELLRRLDAKNDHQRHLLEKIHTFLDVQGKVFQADSSGLAKKYLPASQKAGEEEQMLVARIGQYVGGLRQMSGDSLEVRMCYGLIPQQPNLAAIAEAFSPAKNFTRPHFGFSQILAKKISGKLSWLSENVKKSTVGIVTVGPKYRFILVDDAKRLWPRLNGLNVVIVQAWASGLWLPAKVR